MFGDVFEVETKPVWINSPPISTFPEAVIFPPVPIITSLLLPSVPNLIVPVPAVVRKNICLSAV